MKKQIALTLLVLTTWATTASARDMWIGIEPFVLKSITNSRQRVFEYKDVIKGNKETYFKVDEKETYKLSHFIHHSFKRCGGYRVLHNKPEVEKKILDNKALFSSTFGNHDWQKVINPDYTIDQADLVESWFPHVSRPYTNSVITHLSSYRTRFYKSEEGIAALKWIGSEWERLTAARNDAKVEYFYYQTHDQPSVILTIEGSDPVLKNEIIVLGGHGDSINDTDHSAASPAPGADDNAAGIAVLSDIIRIMVDQNYKPKHTIQFIAYAAEEVGIQGSYDLVRVYRDKQIKVIGVLQLDGVNYNGSPNYDMALISDYTNKEQNMFLASLIDTYLKLPWTWDQCNYGCSDHSAWNYEGYRASFPVEALVAEENPYIHSEQDTFDKSNFDSVHATKFTKLAIAYLLELDQ